MKLVFLAGAGALLLSSVVLLAPHIPEGGKTPESAGVAPLGDVVVHDRSDTPLDERVRDVPRLVADSGTPSPDAVTLGQETLSYDWPSGREVPVVRQFSAPEERWLAGHRGVDLAMEESSQVLAAGDGRVIHAGNLNDRNLVSIQHADGLRTTYEPISPSIAKGDVVVKGQIIGILESGHAGPTPVLHWGAKRPGDDYIDPLSLLNRVPIRLWE